MNILYDDNEEFTSFSNNNNIDLNNSIDNNNLVNNNNNLVNNNNSLNNISNVSYSYSPNSKNYNDLSEYDEYFNVLMRSKLSFSKYNNKVPSLKNKYNNNKNVIKFNNSLNSSLNSSLNNSINSTPRCSKDSSVKPIEAFNDHLLASTPKSIPLNPIGIYQTISPKCSSKNKIDNIKLEVKSEPIVLSTSDINLMQNICKKHDNKYKTQTKKIEINDKDILLISQADQLLLSSEKLMEFNAKETIKSFINLQNKTISFPEDDLLKTITSNPIKYIPKLSDPKNIHCDQNIEDRSAKMPNSQSKVSISIENLNKLKRAEKELLEAMDARRYLSTPPIRPLSIKEKIKKHLETKNIPATSANKINIQPSSKLLQPICSHLFRSLASQIEINKDFTVKEILETPMFGKK